MSNLRESGENGKEQSGAQAQIDERTAPDVAIDRRDDFLHAGSPHYDSWRRSGCYRISEQGEMLSICRDQRNRDIVVGI
jgi:hypothetical protein